MRRFDRTEIATVFRKDLTEVLRDYRTLLIMIVFPVIIYPLSLVLPVIMVDYMKRDMQQDRKSIVLEGDFKSAEKFFRKDKKIKVVSFESPERALGALEKREIDLIVRFPPDFTRTIEGDLKAKPKVVIVFNPKDPKMALSIASVRMTLGEFRKSVVQERSASLHYKPPEIYDILVRDVKVKQEGTLLSQPIRTVVPFFFFAMIILAVVYPAIDIVTGERERNSLTLLLVSPVSRQSIVLGKLLVISACSFTTMVLGLTSLFLVLSYMSSTHSEMDFTFSPLGFLFCILIVTPLVVSMSAMGLLLASLCKTFQQGQGYFTPFLIVGIASSGVCSMPDLKLSSGIAFIPIVNTALCMKEVLSGSADWPWVAVTFTVSIVFALLVCRVATGMLDREELLFGLEKPRKIRWRDGDFLRELLVLLVLIFLLMFYGGQSLQLWDMTYGTILTQLLVIALPAFLFLKIVREPVPSTWRLKLPTPSQFAGALLLTPLCVLASIVIFELQSKLVPAPELFETLFKKMIDQSDKPLWVVILGLAAAPAIGEEILFRGTVLGLVRRRLGPVASCVTVGLLFGLFHTSIFRILPTAALGTVLSAVTLATGSIFPAMIIHLLNNATAVAVTRGGSEALLLTYWPLAVLSGAAGVALIFGSLFKSKFGSMKKKEE
ncbi:MAG: ABC transporter permease subunit/CPBP intramembrane protease [Candidatus Obscuribacterales bacterium]